MACGGTFSLTVFCNESMNGPWYHRLLQHTVLPKLREWNVGNLDRAPFHVTHVNMRYLDNQFQHRVSSRKPIRSLDWPARGPDLNLCDFCLWKYLKSKVYSPRPATQNQLEANIKRKVVALDPDMMRRAILDMRNRARLCIAKNGGHFEK